MLNIVIVANCFEFEIRRSLRSRVNASLPIHFKVFSTYNNQPDLSDYSSALCSANIVITQNPKSVEWANPASIRSICNPKAAVVKTEFWRFNGFWPVETPLARSNRFFWFPVDEFGLEISWDEYNSFAVEESMVLNNFRNELKKFIEIDSRSDVPMIDFFLKNLYSSKLFSDCWHPMPIFFDELALRIAQYCGLPLQNQIQGDHPPMGINGDRHRLIPKSVLEILGLPMDTYQQDIYYFGVRISTQVYYEFAQSISRPDELRTIVAQDLLKQRFYDFAASRGIMGR